jgi:D-alanyl-D-alanine carboxypeptidase
MARKTLFLLFFLSVFLFWSSGAKAAAIEQLRRQLEILKFELSILQSLLKNMQSQQAVSAASYMAVNLADNAVLLEKNSGQSYPVASITKLMAAAVALENINRDQKITLTEEMLKPLGHSPSLYLGLNVSMENLLQAALVQSANDAAEAFSHFVGKQKFIELMNQKAKDLGMESAVFYDTHGLSPKNSSTASDLAKLVTYIYKNHPEILETTKNNDFWLADKTGTLLKFRNVNNFYPLSNFVGGKTGYLLKARQTFAGAFNVNGKTLAIVVLHSDNPQADVFSLLARVRN